jgi:hypothetical protein
MVTKHEENFNPGDRVQMDSAGSHTFLVLEQINQWLKVKMIYHKGEEMMVDVTRENVYRVNVGDY